MDTNFSEQLIKQSFTYNGYTIVFTIKTEYQPHSRYSSLDVDYIRPNSYHGSGYYRTVTVWAYEGVDGSVVDSASSDEYAIRSRTVCKIRDEPYVPDITVPDDPKVTLSEIVVAVLEGKSIAELKEEKRKNAQERWDKNYHEAGPAVPVYKQLEDTIGAVLDELDFQDDLVDDSISIDVDVTMDSLDELSKESVLEE